MSSHPSAPHAGLAPLFDTPYYAVIFTSQRSSQALGYAETAEHMLALAAQQPGFLGVESSRGADGLGITVSYWRSLQDIATWRRQGEHQGARDQGRADWYLHYALRIAKVERSYGWDHLDGSADPLLKPQNPPQTQGG